MFIWLNARRRENTSSNGAVSRDLRGISRIFCRVKRLGGRQGIVQAIAWANLLNCAYDLHAWCTVFSHMSCYIRKASGSLAEAGVRSIRIMCSRISSPCHPQCSIFAQFTVVLNPNPRGSDTEKKATFQKPVTHFTQFEI